MNTTQQLERDVLALVKEFEDSTGKRIRRLEVKEVLCGTLPATRDLTSPYYHLSAYTIVYI